MATEPNLPPPPAPVARAAPPAVLRPPPPPVGRGAPAAQAKQSATTRTGASGHIDWSLASYPGHRHPNHPVPTPVRGYDPGARIRIDGSGGQALGGPDAVTAFFVIDWEHNGRSLGNVRIANDGTDQSGRPLMVSAEFVDDGSADPPDCAAIHIRFRYRFYDGGRSDSVRIFDVRLFGNGQHRIDTHWEQM